MELKSMYGGDYVSYPYSFSTNSNTYNICLRLLNISDELLIQPALVILMITIFE